jgi:hypothetical protein
VPHQQGDQIGRIFARWVIVIARFGHVFKNRKVAKTFLATFSIVKVTRMH